MRIHIWHSSNFLENSLWHSANIETLGKKVISPLCYVYNIVFWKKAAPPTGIQTQQVDWKKRIPPTQMVLCIISHINARRHRSSHHMKYVEHPGGQLWMELHHQNAIHMFQICLCMLRFDNFSKKTHNICKCILLFTSKFKVSHIPQPHNSFFQNLQHFSTKFKFWNPKITVQFWVYILISSSSVILLISNSPRN